MPGFPDIPIAHAAGILTIALIGPDEGRRKAVATALAECQGTGSPSPRQPRRLPHGQVEPTLLDGTRGLRIREESVPPGSPPDQGSVPPGASQDRHPSAVPGEPLTLNGINDHGFTFERVLLDEVNDLDVIERSLVGGPGHPQGPIDPFSPVVSNEHSSANPAAVTELSSYPLDLSDPARVLDREYDVIIIDLDTDPEYALKVVKSICDDAYATVMVYSAQADRDMVVRCMRAGAREFLALPLASADMADALARVTVRRPVTTLTKRAAAKLIVFLGSKGGCGVTTIASNFAVSLAQESGQKILLIDLGLPLGDAAINLGMLAEYSTHNALHEFNRLDANFLSSLLALHSSGLYVLAAPGDFPNTQPPTDAVDKLLSIAREEFDFVVVDLGSRLDLKDSALFDASATFYLVTQVGISELRNANRLITRFFAGRDHDLQIVINRFAPRYLLFDEAHVVKALTRVPQWRIPDDWTSARRTRNTATPLALEDSPISIAIRQMARKACGLPELQEKKKSFSLFGRS